MPVPPSEPELRGVSVGALVGASAIEKRREEKRSLTPHRRSDRVECKVGE